MGVRLRVKDLNTLCTSCEHAQIIKAIDGSIKSICHAVPFGASPIMVNLLLSVLTTK